MRGRSNPWALVLAAGDGTRLRSLTTAPSGATIPKQYCCLHDGPSLLEESIQRAHAVADEERTCVVVADQHRRWWQPVLAAHPADNVIVQPANRGTAHGILLPLLHIAGRDPDAKVVVLPSDHHVRLESVLAAVLREAVAALARRDDITLLLGFKPEYPDPELGYIVPGDADRGMRRVVQFVEKPSTEAASALLERGALWNSFILAAGVRALLDMFRRCAPATLASMQDAVRRDGGETDGGAHVESLYRRLPTLDYSRDVLAGEIAHLRVMPVPPCGWTDLGTPRRVADALRDMPPRVPMPVACNRARLSLAAQHARLHAC
jgi:mannose-1-phosphate guanylyltransferase